MCGNSDPDQAAEGRCIQSELMYWPFLAAYSRNVPTSVKPNFRCRATDASFGSAMPATINRDAGLFFTDPARNLYEVMTTA
jgi:hypothetical protein